MICTTVSRCAERCGCGIHRSNPTFRSWTKSGLLPFRSPSTYEGVSLYLSYLLAHRAGRFYLLPLSPTFYLLPSISCLLSPALSLSYLLTHRAGRCESFEMLPVAYQRQTARCILYRQPWNDAFADCCALPGILQYRLEGCNPVRTRVSCAVQNDRCTLSEGDQKIVFVVS